MEIRLAVVVVLPGILEMVARAVMVLLMVQPVVLVVPPVVLMETITTQVLPRVMVVE
jgi:hypothetical protein